MAHERKGQQAHNIFHQIPLHITPSHYFIMPLTRHSSLLLVAALLLGSGSAAPPNCANGTSWLLIRIDESITDAKVHVIHPKYQGNPPFDEPSDDSTFEGFSNLG